MKTPSNIRYFLQLAYDGTAYHGWQIQENANTIQAELNRALKTLLREEVNVIGCGRTDTGVHARDFYAHVDVSKPHPNPDDLAYKLNCLLPRDIAIERIFQVDPEFHARFSAEARTYEYHLARTKNPFAQHRVYHFTPELDMKLMNEAGQILTTYTDFSTFSKSGTQVKTNNCAVSSAVWETGSDPWVFTIRADRFLRNMVRAVVGTMLQVGLGKMTLEQLHAAIEAKDRSLAGPSVPAAGLYLTRIEYPQEMFNYAGKL